LVAETFPDVPKLIIDQTIQSQFELMFGVKHLAPKNSSERRGSVVSTMSDVLDDFTETEKTLPCEQIERLLPIVTPKTKKRLMSIRRSRRKPDA
jgi:hypothetical protein